MITWLSVNHSMLDQSPKDIYDKVCNLAKNGP